MLVIVCTTALLFGLGVLATAKVARAVLSRFDLDLMDVLLWLGLAEWPAEMPAPRRYSVRRAVVERPDGRRRRSPHRRLGQFTARRRPATSPPAR